MSIIAVKKTVSGFDFVSDNQTTWGYNKYPKKENVDASIEAKGKIFQVLNMTIGCAGNVAHIGMLQIFCKNHLPQVMNCDEILNWFLEFRDWCYKKTGIIQKDISMHCIIAKDNRAFTFYDFLEVNEILDFDAVGSGMWLAIGAMESGASAEDAVRVAIKYDLFCGGNIHKISI